MLDSFGEIALRSRFLDQWERIGRGSRRLVVTCGTAVRSGADGRLAEQFADHGILEGQFLVDHAKLWLGEVNVCISKGGVGDDAEGTQVPPKAWCVAKVESRREVLGEGKVETDTRYYISSLPGNAKQIGHEVRSHWGVENGLRRAAARVEVDSAWRNRQPVLGSYIQRVALTPVGDPQ